MIAPYLQHFEAIFDGEPWFGDSFNEKLKDLTEAEAFTRPADNIHSIAELLSHCIYWRLPLIKKLEGDHQYKGSMKSEENWLPLEKLKAKGWKKLLKEWNESQRHLIALLQKTPDTFLKEPFRDGHTNTHLIDGILQHDIYHLGQIGLVRKWIGK
mgnify:CR=1 FL=1